MKNEEKKENRLVKIKRKERKNDKNERKNK